jgi:hypothetical protein
MAQRFPKLTPDEMSATQREVAAQIAAGPRGEVREAVKARWSFCAFAATTR